MASRLYINYFDEIDDNRVRGMMSYCADSVGKHKFDELYFMISTPGGSVSAGITFYNYLRLLPAKIIMHNTGSIDSIGAVIFLAGDERYAAPHSSFLIHGIRAHFPKDQETTLTQIAEAKNHIEEDHNKIAGIFMERTKISQTEMDKLFSQGEAKNLAFAKTMEIIHEIKEPRILPGNAFVTINTN